MRTPNKAISLAIAAALVVGLAACVPKAATADNTAASVDVAQVFSDNGISIVPFGGGDPVRKVTGESVLVLTQWQVDNIQNGMRASGATISLDALDAAAPPKENEFDPYMKPSQVLMAWWGFVDSPRADLARAAYPAPALNQGYAVPIYVVVLFEADTFADFGRTDAQASAVAPGARPYALGADGVYALDACGVVGQAIDDVNGFLTAVGAPPKVVGTAVDAAYGVVNALTGDALDYFHKVIGVMNIVMTVSSLITPWKIEQTLTADSFQLGLNGKAGDGGVLQLSITGVVGQPPAEVKSCLDLFGLKDPTSLEGTTFQVVANEVVYSPSALGISPSMIVADYTPGELRTLDENNLASVSFTTGMQTIDPKDTSVYIDQDPYILLLDIKRSDVGQISKWIRSAVDNQAYKILLGTALAGLADRIEVAANPLMYPKPVPVSYLVPKGTEVGETGQIHDDAPSVDDPQVKEGIGDCLSISYIEALTGHTVQQHIVEPPATYSTVTNAPPGVTALDPKATCIYDLDNTWRLQIVWPYTIWDDGALDLFLVGNVEPAPENCSRIGGPNLLHADSDQDGAETYSYFVWDGLNMSTILMTGSGSGAHQNWLGTMAADLGWCQRPELINWGWDKKQ